MSAKGFRGGTGSPRFQKPFAHIGCARLLPASCKQRQKQKGEGGEAHLPVCRVHGVVLHDGSDVDLMRLRAAPLRGHEPAVKSGDVHVALA